ncbi:hypothetical protein FHR71_004023 [Methylobacterium sp. RAS18]|nr:hypothetical protein [Methylobacterium sp. RAS18]
MAKLLKILKRWLYLGHRWLGIVTCLLFAIWFMSGVVMMYVGFPALSDAERRAGLQPLRWDGVQVSPSDALAAAGQPRFPQDLRLQMLGTEPVYRVTAWNGARTAVSAQSGRIIDNVGGEQALAVAAQDPRAVRPSIIDEVTRDQWSVTARYDPLRPFHLIALEDPAGTHLYVSARTGEVALDTSRTECVWNWLGAIPHWIYLTPLRAQAELWREVVLWVSGISIVTAMTGFWIGVLRLRLKNRYRLGRVTPYRGWPAWHHLAGVIGGVTLITFVVSGWLSMNPNRWFSSRAVSQAKLERYAGTTEPSFALAVQDLKAVTCTPAVELRLYHIGGRPQVTPLCRDSDQNSCCRDAPVPRERLLTAARQLLQDAPITRTTLLEAEDAYWYSHHQTRQLPVLRVEFADPESTWLHIDPATGEVLGGLDHSGRIRRWLFNGLHTLDFVVLLARRPAWDVMVWLLSTAGLIISLSGIVLGWRRLR